MKKYLYLLFEVALTVLIYLVSSNLLICLLCGVLMIFISFLYGRRGSKNKNADLWTLSLFMRSFISYYQGGETILNAYQKSIKDDFSSSFTLTEETDKAVLEKLHELTNIYQNKDFDLFVKLVTQDGKKDSKAKTLSIFLSNFEMIEFHKKEENRKRYKNGFDNAIYILSVPCLIVLIKVIMSKYYESFVSLNYGSITILFICVVSSISLSLVVSGLLKEKSYE